MKRFIEGEDRTQVTLLPACLDDYVEVENPVRVVEVFVMGSTWANSALLGLTRRLRAGRRTTRRCC